MVADGTRVAPATPGDLPEIVRLVNRAYRGDAARQGWTHEADLIDGQRTDAAALAATMSGSSPVTVLVLRGVASGPILACVQLEAVAGEPGRWHLGMLTVAPERQGHGLGRALLAAAEGHVRDRGGRAIVMTVIHVRDALIAWYERRGYRRTGDVRPFPYGDARVGLPRRDDLAFVVMEKTV